MVEHPTEERLAAYARRALEPRELIAADEHLAACEACRARLPRHSAPAALESLRRTVAAGPAEHLGEEELAALVDGALGDVEREIAAAHLEGCPRCTADVDALREVAKTDLQPGRVFRPAASSAGAPSRSWATRWLPVAAVIAAGAVALGLFLARPARESPAPVAQTSPAPEGPALDDSGRNVRLDPSGRVAGLDDLAPEVRARAAAALASGHIAVADVSDLLPRREQLMGGAPTTTPFALSAPVAVVVESAQPTLRWQALPGAESYRVTVADVERLTPVAESPSLRTLEWTPPAPLPRGRTYTWQVAASSAGRRVVAPAPPAADVRFRVLDAARNEALATARAGRGSHLVLGILYAEAGLLEDARRELLALRRDNPQAPLAEALLANLPAY